MPSFTIARLAQAADVHVETVRYYQRRGLLAEPPREPGSIRRYSDVDVETLRFIKRAQGAGFTLEEAANLLALRCQVCCSATRAVAASKLEMIDQRLAQLRDLRAQLAGWIADCDANPTEASCPVINHLDARI